MGNQVLLVTGGSRGIGAAVSLLAGSRGYSVGVNFKSDARAASSVVDAIKAAGGKAVAVRGDMSREEDVARVVAETERALGRLTDLVYNSGITGKASRLEAATTQAMREVIDVNVMGALYCARSAIPRISKKQGGAGGGIVFISSIASVIGGAGEYVWYAASKGAVDSLTYGLAKELAGDGIRVNAVAPGLIETDIHPPGRLERMAPLVPMGRTGTAQEVADSVVFLLSDAASYITGSILRVSGGR